MRSDNLSLRRFLKNKEIRDGRALLVGSRVYDSCDDRREMYRECVGVDIEDGEGVDIVHDMEVPLPDSVGRFNHVDCCSVLEHCKRPWLVAESIQACMASGASLLVSVPFVWRVHNYPGDYWRMTPEALQVIFHNVQWFEFAYYSHGKKHPKPRSKEDEGSVWLERSELFAFGWRV